jgi:hypothetical protein
MCVYNVLLSLVQWTTLVAALRNLVNITSHDDDRKIYDWCICCDGSCRGTSFITGSMMLYCKDEGSWLALSILPWALWCLHDCRRLWPSRFLWQGAWHCLALCTQLWGPLWQEAHHCLAWHTRPIALVMRGSLLYPAQSPPWQQFVIALFGKGLIVALLDKCGLLGVLAMCALGIVHAIFGILAVLALGNVHAFSNVLAEPNLGVCALLVIAWRNMVVVTSCKQQHIIFYCCVGVPLVLPLHLSGIVIAPCNMTRNDCRIVDVVIVLSWLMSSLALHAFGIIDVVDTHQL